MQFDARAAKLLAAGQHFTISEYPGLRLEASASKKSWIYRYKCRSTGKMKQVKIGEWPAMSAPAAAVSWESLKADLANGEDPGAARKAERQKVREAVVAEKARKAQDDFLVRDLCDAYYEKRIVVNRKQKGADEVRRIFDTMIDKIADMRPGDVTRAVAFDLIESFTHIPVQAGKLRAELGSAWDYGHDSARLSEEVPNWWRLIMRGKLRSKGRKIQGEAVGTSKRVLSPAEVTVLIPWLPNLSRLVEEALTMYLWTGARGNEFLQMEAPEITEEADGLWWTCPKAKTKNGWREDATDYRVPLIGRAEKIVRRRLATAEGGYLWPSRGEYPYIQQKTIGAQVWMHMPYAQTRPTYDRPRLSVIRWAPHDLRRTARTLLAALKCPDEVGEAIIGHMKEGVKGIYNRHEYDEEKRAWLIALDRRLEELATA